MYAKTLVKLIDYAIFPAVLIAFAKIGSAILFSRYFDFSYKSDGVRIVFESAEAFIAVNSYSSLVMFFAVLSGLGWVIVKAHLFHDTHISPPFSAKLFSMNLQELIHTTETIYSQAFIWLSFAWLTTLVFGVYSYLGLSYNWIFFVSLIFSIIATALLVIDMEREIKSDKEMFDIPFEPTNRVVKFSEEIFVS